MLASGVLPLVRLLRSALNERPEEAPGPLPVPAFVITSTLDPVAPVPWARRLADLSGAQFQLVEGPHNWCWTNTEEADRAVRGIADVVIRTQGADTCSATGSAGSTGCGIGARDGSSLQIPSPD